MSKDYSNLLIKPVVYRNKPPEFERAIKNLEKISEYIANKTNKNMDSLGSKDVWKSNVNIALKNIFGSKKITDSLLVKIISKNLASPLQENSSDTLLNKGLTGKYLQLISDDLLSSMDYRFWSTLFSVYAGISPRDLHGNNSENFYRSFEALGSFLKKHKDAVFSKVLPTKISRPNNPSIRVQFATIINNCPHLFDAANSKVVNRFNIKNPILVDQGAIELKNIQGVLGLTYDSELLYSSAIAWLDEASYAGKYVEIQKFVIENENSITGLKYYAIECAIWAYNKIEGTKKSVEFYNFVVHFWLSLKLEGTYRGSNWSELKKRYSDLFDMMLKWSHQESLRQFFELLVNNGDSYKRKERFEFWSNYISQASSTILVFGQKSLITSNEALKKFIEHEKEVSWSSKVDAFVLDINNLRIVEFADEGGIYVYNKNKFEHKFKSNIETCKFEGTSADLKIGYWDTTDLTEFKQMHRHGWQNNVRNALSRFRIEAK